MTTSLTTHAPPPPGPRGHWLLRLNDEVTDPLGLLIRAWQRHGDIVHFNSVHGPMYLLAHPDHARHVLVDNARNYPAPHKPPNRVMGNGLFQSGGDFWLRQRSMVQPTFHRPRLVAMAAGLAEGIGLFAARWEEAVRTGEPVDVLEHMRQLVPTLLGASLFSRDVYDDQESLRACVAFFSQNSHGSARDSLWKVAMRRLRLPPSRARRFLASVEALDASLYTLIARRRAHPGPGEDILGMLLEARDASGEAMTDTEVRDELVSLLIGGHEATSVALAWTWYALMSHPEVERRVREELATVLGGRPADGESLHALRYTRAVVEEVLRLYPPAWRFMRRAQEDEQLGGFTIRGGGLVVLSPYLLHRHPSVWEEPERFDPERFLPERKEGRHRHAWLPFGGGQRLCIGNHYTLLLITAVLATLLPRFQARLVPGHPIVPLASNTYRPRFGVRATLHSAPSRA